MKLAAAILISAMLATAPAAAQTGQVVLVARQVGNAWRVDAGAGAKLESAVSLKPGQTIVLLDSRGIRYFRGPGVVQLDGQNTKDGLVRISFRALRQQSPERWASQTRGKTVDDPAPAEDSDFSVIHPRNPEQL